MRFSREYNPLSSAVSHWKALRGFCRKGAGKPSERFTGGKDLTKGIMIRVHVNFTGRALSLMCAFYILNCMNRVSQSSPSYSLGCAQENPLVGNSVCCRGPLLPSSHTCTIRQKKTNGKGQTQHLTASDESFLLKIFVPEYTSHAKLVLTHGKVKQKGRTSVVVLTIFLTKKLNIWEDNK